MKLYLSNKDRLTETLRLFGQSQIKVANQARRNASERIAAANVEFANRGIRGGPMLPAFCRIAGDEINSAQAETCIALKRAAETARLRYDVTVEKSLLNAVDGAIQGIQNRMLGLLNDACAVMPNPAAARQDAANSMIQSAIGARQASANEIAHISSELRSKAFDRRLALGSAGLAAVGTLILREGIPALLKATHLVP